MSKKSKKNRPEDLCVNVLPVADAGRRKVLIAGASGLGALMLSSSGCENTTRVSQTTPTPAPTAAQVPAVASTPVTVAAAAAALPPLKPATYPADRKNALQAAHEIAAHYTLVLNTPSCIIHAVRGFGKGFALADGSNAVNHLCTYYAQEKTVNGQRYVYFPRSWEVHEHSFLKTFLEAGVSADQPLTAGHNRYTLQQLGEHAKATFRLDPNNLNRYEPKYYFEHLPWGLIALSTLNPPPHSRWTNAWNEPVNLAEVVDRAVASYQTECAGISEVIAHNEPEPEKFRAAMREHSCFGLHAIYGFFACLKNGYRNNDLTDRLKGLLETTILRLEGDGLALDREFAEAGRKTAAGGGEAKLQQLGLTVATITEAFRLRAQIKLIGHAFEAINFVLLHKLFTLTPEQKHRTQIGEQQLYQHIVKLRAMDLEPLRKVESNSKFVNDIVIALGHAVRGLKLLTPENPDNATMNVARK